jgi:hypothetical protein
MRDISLQRLPHYQLHIPELLLGEHGRRLRLAGYVGVVLAVLQCDEPGAGGGDI